MTKRRIIVDASGALEIQYGVFPSDRRTCIVIAADEIPSFLDAIRVSMDTYEATRIKGEAESDLG